MEATQTLEGLMRVGQVRTGYESGLQLSVMHNELQITPAVLVGQSTAVHLHRYANAFFTDPPGSLENINAFAQDKLCAFA